MKESLFQHLPLCLDGECSSPSNQSKQNHIKQAIDAQDFAGSRQEVSFSFLFYNPSFESSE